jgi:hypothetical protein
VKVRAFTVIRYEADKSEPASEVLENFKRRYGLNGELDRYFAAPRTTKRSGASRTP